MMNIIISVYRRFNGIFILPIKRKYYRRYTKYTHTGKIALCCIAKLENDYIRFFVEYYKNLHFDKIIIFDNNEPDGERFEEVIGDHIQSKFVEIIDFRGKEAPQLEAYQNGYDRYNKEYDWIAFFDCDEFLTFVDGTQDIHTFLSREIYNPFQIIYFNWMVYGDNELLDNDGRNVIDRFRNPVIPYNFKAQYKNYPENYLVKSIVRGGLFDIRWTGGSHTPLSYCCKCCNSKGISVALSHIQDIDYSISYIRHYSTKTIGEWVRNKMKRGDVYYTGEKGKKMISLDYFYRYNKKTLKKDNYAKMILNDITISIDDKDLSSNVHG